MWPNSPANPFTPRCSVPFATTPPPMPVPSVTSNISSTPMPAPRRHSAAVSRRWRRCRRGPARRGARKARRRSSKSATPSRLGAARNTPVAGDQTRHADADAAAVVERIREFEEHLHQRIEAVVATWCRSLRGLDDQTLRIEDDRLRFGPADVDADPARWCRSDRTGRGHASARAFNSRTVLRMRTSARRLTNPGNGIARSISRS
jgi:hypothetical protein